ncbi:glycosyltransferase family 4 protein [Azospirillum canadense]|uniref:glycosyltransferase family 4 protein n=1 Tax=Azospirillum canadense TaxID=403962 RepID=UPI002226CE63|nr:glycosyltransferase family 4 protein [Azospirillum canadense]MCW2240934.1 glycosyltransferase involved in cell wall biosynthesis [Azospirillum canadense]
MTNDTSARSLADRSSATGRPLRVLTITTLYPNAVTPSHGVFVENRLRALAASGAVDLKVVAPVPWFPSANPLFGHYATHARVPAAEIRHGIAVSHPRYPAIPRVGMTVAPSLLYAALRRALKRTPPGPIDLIDAHYVYPDGVAAAMLGRKLGVPVVITARGTDVNLIPRHALPRRQIQWAARQAAGLITVCSALKDALIDLEVEPGKIRVIRNGVDLRTFHPAPEPDGRDAARNRFGVRRKLLLSVGQLIERKGHRYAIEALTRLPDWELIIAGHGPDHAMLTTLAERLGVGERVRLLGAVSHDALPALYTAADALVLASSREGWANVLLEAMACGTPVIATAVWGTPEVVSGPEAGVLMRDRSADAVVEALEQLAQTHPGRAATRAYAERFSWDQTTRDQIDLFTRIVQAGETPGTGARTPWPGQGDAADAASTG